MTCKDIILAALLLIVASCRKDDAKPVVSSKVEREVERRMAVVKSDQILRQSQLRTYRIIGFIVLTGGSVAGIVWIQSQRAPVSFAARPRPLQRPSESDHHATHSTRVLDITPCNPSQHRVPNETSRRS